jgi:hypothetical protein
MAPGIRRWYGPCRPCRARRVRMVQLNSFQTSSAARNAVLVRRDPQRHCLPCVTCQPFANAPEVRWSSVRCPDDRAYSGDQDASTASARALRRRLATRNLHDPSHTPRNRATRSIGTTLILGRTHFTRIGHTFISSSSKVYVWFESALARHTVSGIHFSCIASRQMGRIRPVFCESE